MMKRIFDIYYIVLERAINEMNAPGMMAGSIMFNIFSLFMMVSGERGLSVSTYLIAIVLIVVVLTLSIIFSVRYGRKRTEKLRQEYADLDVHARQNWIAGVVAYEVITVILVVLSFWLTARNASPQEVLPFTLPDLHPPTE
jgi:heme/copper-type cytochrome/quinol oxidase subunit 4